MYEEDKSHQFLMGLNDDEFSSIRSQILAQDPLPKLDKIFHMVIQEETHNTHDGAARKQVRHGCSFCYQHIQDGTKLETTHL